MKIRKVTGVFALGVLVAAGLAGSSLRAADDDGSVKKAVIAVQSPMQIPGTVLKPGSYVFKQSGSQSGWNIVQIYDHSETTLVTTVLAYPNPKLSANGQTVITYGTPAAGDRQVLEAVVLPGDDSPEQFAYPKIAADRIGAANHVRIPTTGTSDAYPSALPDAASSWSAPVDDAANAQTVDPNAGAGMTAQNNAPADPTALPQTASPLPLIALIGFMSLVGIVALRKFAGAKA